MSNHILHERVKNINNKNKCTKNDCLQQIKNDIHIKHSYLISSKELILTGGHTIPKICDFVLPTTKMKLRTKNNLHCIVRVKHE